MSRDFTAYLEYFNNDTNKWEAVQIFSNRCYCHEGELTEVPFIDGGWSDAASILLEDGNFPDFRATYAIQPNTLSDEVRIHYNNILNEDGKPDTGYFGYGCVNLADVKIYTLKYPTVNDYDESWPDNVTGDDDPRIPQMENPLIWILKRAIFFRDVNDLFYQPWSQFRIVFWADH